LWRSFILKYEPGFIGGLSSPIASLNLVPAERRGWLLLGEFLLFEFEPGIDLGVA
jgi:hypothetical protein